MKFPAPVSLSWVATLINAELVGTTDKPATGINEIHKVEAGDLVFVDHPKYYITCLESAASFIIINTKDVTVPEGKALLVVDSPFEAYQTITNHFRPFQPSNKSISDSAIIGEGTTIMPHVYIGNHVNIGKNCVIYPNVTILDYTIIGNNVVIQAGTVIGGDAFYYNTKKNREAWFKRMNSCGNVIIEDNVEIGCSCTIDRGVSASTIVGKGTIIDNMVQLGHEVVIGKNCLIGSQVGIAGVTTLEDGVTLWGQVGVSKTLTIGENAVVLAQAGVNKTIEGNKTYWGTPVMNAKDKQKENVWVKRIPALWKKVMEADS
ncbi:UDP-3-O-(3-hydroxymyristoyl)glucosamine N-acyltransferase [Parasediminibacterium sp. JCM 36343]|uniref:UDP-3-O-(3-hydroxymyristoyl)glucosamine N-acyltransferase n=1 Tax=Parasediminibacterium sp. JCM 36343 TaxID=3374279 RepID=UPI00397E5C5C